MRKPGKLYSISYRCSRTGKLSAASISGIQFQAALIRIQVCKSCEMPHKFYLDGSEYLGDDPDMVMSEGGTNETSTD